jgi:hypothetical protein
MQGCGRIKPRNPARYVAIKEDSGCVYFQISTTGTLISPPEFSSGRAEAPPLELSLSAYLPPPNSRSHIGHSFVGFFDERK